MRATDRSSTPSVTEPERFPPLPWRPDGKAKACLRDMPPPGSCQTANGSRSFGEPAWPRRPRHRHRTSMRSPKSLGWLSQGCPLADPRLIRGPGRIPKAPPVAFQSAIHLAVRLPESFRGGCSFGAEGVCFCWPSALSGGFQKTPPVSPAGIKWQYVSFPLRIAPVKPACFPLAFTGEAGTGLSYPSRGLSQIMGVMVRSGG